MKKHSESFNRIGLVWKDNDEAVDSMLAKVIAYLTHKNKIIYAPKPHGHISDAMIVSFEDMAQNTDLIVTIGGDGTIIKAARRLSQYSAKLIGINQGRLGFLADIQPENFASELDEIMKGHFHAEKRLLLNITVQRDGSVVFRTSALNDAVIHKWSNIRMLELETSVNGEFVHRYRSDGQIVATPTGSTAYALSTGGPILYPTLDALLLVPISPHRLSHRAITLPGDSKINIKICGGQLGNARVTCDGQDDFELEPNDEVQIEKSPHSIDILHPRNHSHFFLLRDKLGWG